MVVGSGVDGSAILDGFTITAGNNLADGAPAHGGGMYNQNGSPTVQNCTFAGNLAASKGGGIFNNTANPTLTNCAFLENRAYEGGGIGNEGSGNFTISGCTFSGNYSGSGGGIYNWESTPNVINCTFSGNTAIILGGAIYNEGSSPIVMNCTFSGNTAPNYPYGGGGGGMYNLGDGWFSFSNPVVTNCIFWSDSDGEIVDNGGTPTVNYCVVQGGYSGGGHIIVADPCLGPFSRNGGATETFQLLPGSSAIDAGTGAGAPATDQRGVARPQNSVVDIGAYESWSKKILTITVSGAGTVSRAPSGTVFGTTGDCWTYDEDTSVTLDASPDAGNMFVEWSGVLTGSADSGTITMSMDHAVSALFDIAWIVAASAGPHGDIAPKGEVVVRNNTDQEFTVSADFGYDISGVAVDDVPVGTASTYTFHSVVEDHTIEASFDLKRYHIVATAGPNGAIDPSGDVIVTHSDDKTFAIAPNAGYGVADVTVDSASVGPVTSYTFQSVSSDHLINVSFDLLPTPTPTPTMTPTGYPTAIPTESPEPTTTPTPVPHPSPNPDIPLPDATLTLTLTSGGTIIIGPTDIFDTKARLDLLESPSLWAQLLATDPDALAAGNFNIGLVRFLSFVAELDQDELEITVLFTVTVGDVPTGYRSVVFLLMRTFDASGKPAGYIVVPKSEGKSVFRKKAGTEIWKVTVRDGGTTDADGKRNGLVMPQIAAVVAVFPIATPTDTPTPTTFGAGGGCSIPMGDAALLLVLLLLPPLLIRRR